MKGILSTIASKSQMLQRLKNVAADIKYLKPTICANFTDIRAFIFSFPLTATIAVEVFQHTKIHQSNHPG